MQNNVRKKIKISNAGRKPSIKFGSELEDTIFNIVSIYNKRNPKHKVKIDIAKEVVNRGINASLGKDKISDDRTEFGLVRLRMFLSKRLGKVNDRYVLDDDLLKK
jgi:hypothetical protein